MKSVVMEILNVSSNYRGGLDGVVRRLQHWTSVMGALGRVPIGANERGCHRLTVLRNILVSTLFSRFR